MATPVLMPKQGITVEECILTQWHKKKGDSVKADEMLFSYETDKASFDAKAPESGILLDTFYNEGDVVPVLQNVCIIGENGEDISAFLSKNDAPKEDTADQNLPIQEEKTKFADESLTVNKDEEDRLKISPRARNFAEKIGADVTAAVPTGPYGRIVEADIRNIGTGFDGGVIQEKAAETAVMPAEVRETDQPKIVKLSGVRKSIARAMMASLSGTAQLTLNLSYDASEVLNYRAKCKNADESLGFSRITIGDIILYAVSRTLLSHPELNANLIDNEIHYFSNTHIGIAVDTPRGLLVPTLFNADKMSLKEISDRSKILAEAAKKGSITPDLLRGGTFTITNLGTFGIESFTPVINPPQTGILGVNTIEDRVRVVNGEIKPYKAMNLSLTFDHRALDGAPAARFLKDLKTNLESFPVLLANC